MVKSETKRRKLWLRSTARGNERDYFGSGGSTEIRLCWKRVMLLNPNDRQGIDNLFLKPTIHVLCHLNIKSSRIVKKPVVEMFNGNLW